MTPRQATLPGFQLADYVRESIDFLQANEPPEGYFVGFSGGKDSIVTLELCRMAGVKHAPHYSQTTIDPPELLQFLRAHYPQVRWVRPAKSFFACVPTSAPPLRTQRWCCDYVKERPSWSIPLDSRVFGIRAEESARRAARGRINPRKITGGRVITGYHPIFHWPEWAVWEFIERHKMSYPSTYDEGFTRLGCVICPYSVLGAGKTATSRRAASMERWPGIWKAFRHSVWRYWQRKRAEGTSDKYAGESFEDFWQAYLRHFEKEDSR